MTKLQQAEKIARHYTDMFNIASSMKYALECMDNSEPYVLDRGQICEYIRTCADKIKNEHLKTFGNKIMEDENG